MPPEVEQVEVNRFTVEALRNIYKECRFNSGELGHLADMDSSSFMNIIVKAIRQGSVPLCWRYHEIQMLLNVVKKFEMTPVRSPRDD